MRNVSRVEREFLMNVADASVVRCHLGNTPGEQFPLALPVSCGILMQLWQSR